jgi:glycosyltransferase involved in cell wall biosynthesis
MSTEQPLFSIIIATRDRPSLLVTSLGSVLEQRFRGFEVIVVNDGSSEEHEREYGETIARSNLTVRLFTLARTERGHGPAYARNSGARHAHGSYLCFLDDDDQWIDLEHLNRAAVVVSCPQKPDLLLANQQAFRNGIPVSEAIWIEDLQNYVHDRPDPHGAIAVTPAQLLRCRAHCHLNTLIISRALFSSIGGFDEGQRYDEDRDLYLRAIDGAESIKFLPFTVARHNIPDPVSKVTASTAESELSKRLYQLRTSDKLITLATRREVRWHEMRYRSYLLRHIAVAAARAGRLDTASYYAREALVSKLTIGWLGITVLLMLRRFGRKLTTANSRSSASLV